MEIYFLKIIEKENAVLGVPPVPLSRAFGIHGLEVVQVLFLGGTGFSIIFALIILFFSPLLV